MASNGGTEFAGSLGAAFAEKMNLFPEVVWDRWGGWYEYPADEDGVVSSTAAFGWLKRGDGKSDFMTLHAFATAERGIYQLSYVTSSASFSREFAERLGITDHQDCRRIEDDFGPLVENVVRL